MVVHSFKKSTVGRGVIDTGARLMPGGSPGDGSSVLSLVVTDLTTSKVGSITEVEEDPRLLSLRRRCTESGTHLKRVPNDS